MATRPIFLRMYFKWWVKPYIKILKLFAMMVGMEPDEDKLITLIQKHGIKKVTACL